MPQLTDNVGVDIGFEGQLNDGDGDYYPMALIPAKKPRLEHRDSMDGGDVSQLSVTNLPRDYLQTLRFDNRMKEIEHMVKELAKKTEED